LCNFEGNIENAIGNSKHRNDQSGPEPVIAIHSDA